MTGPGWRWWVLFALAVLLVGAGAIIVERRDTANTARKFCKLITTLDDAYREQPPTTATGKNVADSIAQLRHDLGCPS